ncbi:PREDICTED: uncharacterized protein LOC108357782 [Rhagoletis zephyria]|uniref:uncharacterized protein LOC108357782 n=1 Tax=Rhagoletis zephyria TaxID=28612 RepID=UPI000811A7FC|nr:PREDICTED: uncharacterized protein LOC108357782 [Rhagoletis zephyria]
MLTSAAIGRSLSCAAQRILPRSIALSAPMPTTATAAQCANRGVSSRAQCAQNVSKSKKEEEKKDNDKPKSMWFNPECCLDPCPDLLPRYDELYYKPSDKLKRKYTQTWVECPRVRVAPKKICCYKKVIPPPFKRRVFKRRTAADECKPRPTDLMPCKTQKMRGKCPTVMLPGCSSARIPPKCKRSTQKANCRKMCTPYPSFSECSKKLRPMQAVECHCLDIPSRCEVWEQLRRRATMKKV